MSTEDVKVTELKAYKHVTGKLDIRRFLLESTSESLYVDLMGKLVRAYKVEPSKMLVYWKDSEGDFVSIEEDEDVRVAINAASGSLLKLYVTEANSQYVSEEFGAASKDTSSTASTSETEQPQIRGGVHHPFVTCDGCNSAIYGRRFKCLECNDYDLCERCELVFNRHPEHNMVLIRRPSPAGCPFGRRRAHQGGPFPGCPVFGPRGQRCGRFRCGPPQAQPQQGAEKPQTTSNEQDLSGSMLNMSLGDVLREAQNGQLSTVLAAVNEALRPLGADFSVLVGEPASRCDSATTTERNANANADSGEQTGTPLNCCSEQSSEAKPPTSSAWVETMRVETNDKPTQSSETMRYPEELQQLKEMGFDNAGGWVEQLLIEKKGNVMHVLDVLMNRRW